MLDFLGAAWYNTDIMENVKNIVSQNLIRLRKEKNLTQAELAKRINYSDKAISRWETGEVLPDLETIYALSEIFEVPVSSITEKRSTEEVAKEQSQELSQRILSQIFLVCEIWLILIVIIVYLNITRNTITWQIFIWGVPATSLLIVISNRKTNANITVFIAATIFNWSLITCIYLHLLDSKPWYIFFVGLPIQGLLVIRYIFNYKQPLKKLHVPLRKRKG